MNELIIKSFNFPAIPPPFRMAKFVWYIILAIEMLLFIRFFLKLFGTNPTGYFTNIIYNMTSYIVYPFTMTFESDAGGINAFEWTTLLAVITYLVLAIGVIKILRIRNTPLSRIEQARALSRKKYSH